MNGNVATLTQPPPAHDAHHPVFVYGTLLSGLSNYSSLFFSKDEQPLITRTYRGFVKGVRMLSMMDNFPMCYITPSMQDVVVGEVHHIKRDAWEDVLKNLDRLEGHPKFYRRMLVRAEMTVPKDPSSLDTTEFVTADIQAWMYVCPPNGVEKVKNRGGVVNVVGGDWKRYLEMKPATMKEG